MPKSAPPRQGNFRSNPYGTWISPSFTSQSNYYPSPASLFDDPPFGMQQRAWGPPSLGSPEGPYDVIIPPPELTRGQHVATVPPAHLFGAETTEHRSRGSLFGDPPTSAAAENPKAEEPQPAQDFKPSQEFKPAQEFRSPQTQLFPRQKQPLKRVDSMVLQAVTRNSRRGRDIPDLRVVSNSYGGGTQCNVYSKVPSVAKTISFNVDDEEALLKAYRHVKAMNPSAPVGGIMFSIGAKGDASRVNSISWDSFAGRSGLGRSFSMNLNGDKFEVFRPLGICTDVELSWKRQRLRSSV
ncbi:uncharacterized protein FFB20_06249 [Fusarium fujikuroi]|uniref:Uncharacterized protein n=1 Tax=Fusarium fujikuroi TaxID=5127 RepID=A0A2H3RQ22_FUSFU|nr:uncharacterized protein Y057_14610 [Fusarium fujikuroi]QGI80086.1 hypothetical protein CEK25_006815 [Fusarium fujikuroi]SCN80805.1 uncharacterized protein FFB20_06249 [Fusarium fujikuroi]SCN91854.1 uncharacterized protein FFC1_06586 [Fusarium fujikuroi]SCO22372.1 uncharacterized protein FFE2_15273 [Fusarium fujikuroi]